MKNAKLQTSVSGAGACDLFAHDFRATFTYQKVDASTSTKTTQRHGAGTTKQRPSQATWSIQIRERFEMLLKVVAKRYVQSRSL
jgi:hypothetical protein